MSWFEKKFGKYAIKNLSLVIIVCYAAGYLLEIPAMRGIDIFNFLSLNPQKIIDDFQIWRLITWIFIPSSSGNIFLELILLYFFYVISKSVEVAWGTYRYNVYIFSGLFFTVLGAFILYAYECFRGNPFFYYGNYFSTYYITLSIFLALASTFPDNQILLFFIIPLKMKVLGIIYVILLGYNMIVYISVGMYAPIVVMVASLLNFIIFFVTQRKKLHFGNFGTSSSPKFKKKTEPIAGNRSSSTNTGITRHKCAICGATDKSNPELSFRFCSKCNGNYEYCENHLFTHTHIQ